MRRRRLLRSERGPRHWIRARKLKRLFLLAPAAVLAGAAVFIADVWLSPRPLLVNRGGASQCVYDSAGNLLRLTLASDEKFRLWVPLAEIAPALIETTLLYEDRYYFKHPGLNPWALGRAFLTTYLSGGIRTGGSTLSMQLARLRFAIHSRTIGGKLRQIRAALVLERHYTKEQILEAYLNLAPYGANIEGAGAASQIYFHKPAAALTPAEAIALAVIPQNPVRRRLAGSKDGGQAIAARSRLAAEWARRQPQRGQMEAELRLPLEPARRTDLPFKAPHLVNQVLSRKLDTDHILTTVDPSLQQVAERAVSSFVGAGRFRGILNAALIVVDWRTMEVKALVGSADYHNAAIEGQVDGTRGRRSPGSALKPFVYGLAIDEGLIHPRSILKDTAASFAAYDPENFDRQFLGPISATDALVRSRNLPAVHLTNALSGDGFYGFLKRAGIKRLREPDFYGLALALGGVEISLQELVRLYAMLPNRGKLRRLRFTSADPREAQAHDSQGAGQLLTPEASFLVLDMLSHNPRPGQEIVGEDELKRSGIAWKTGTSYGFRDAWAVGVFGEYVAGVWTGNFDGKGNPALVGREAAGDLFFRFVDAARLQRQPAKIAKLAAGGKLKKVPVCRVSGMLPGRFCQHQVQTWFIPGKSPFAPCTVHREVEIDEATGLRACEPQQHGIKRAVFEFWPSDLLALFRQAGIPRTLPPPYRPECRETESYGVKPEIVSPERGLVYQMRLSHLQPAAAGAPGLVTDEPIPLRAVTDADATAVYWFVDDKLIGSSRPSEALLWRPSAGRFVVRAVDDHGRADSRELRIDVVE